MISRARIDDALQQVRLEAFAAGQFVGQESFMTADRIDALAARAGIRPGDRLLDVCCGLGGPGRRITAATGCRYLGVDADAEAVRLAEARSTGSASRYLHARVPPLPGGGFDVVVLLETLLAFPDKPALMRAVAAAVTRGGRFAFTVEEGAGLDAAERSAMPASDTVWPVPLGDLQGVLVDAGFAVDSCVEETGAQLPVVSALLGAFRLHSQGLRDRLGEAFVDDLIASHTLWREWMASGRIRKFSLVARRT